MRVGAYCSEKVALDQAGTLAGGCDTTEKAALSDPLSDKLPSDKGTAPLLDMVYVWRNVSPSRRSPKSVSLAALVAAAPSAIAAPLPLTEMAGCPGSTVRTAGTKVISSPVNVLSKLGYSAKTPVPSEGVNVSTPGAIAVAGSVNSNWGCESAGCGPAGSSMPPVLMICPGVCVFSFHSTLKSYPQVTTPLVASDGIETSDGS